MSAATIQDLGWNSEVHYLAEAVHTETGQTVIMLWEGEEDMVVCLSGNSHQKKHLAPSSRTFRFVPNPGADSELPPVAVQSQILHHLDHYKYRTVRAQDNWIVARLGRELLLYITFDEEDGSWSVEVEATPLGDPDGPLEPVDTYRSSDFYKYTLPQVLEKYAK